MEKEGIKSETLRKEIVFQDANIIYKTRARFSIFYEDNKEKDDYLNKLLEGAKGSLLILGCGDTDITALLDKGFDHIVGIDISPKSIEKVNEIIKKKGLEKRVVAIVMDAHNLEFEEDFFDFIIGAAVLHHLNIEKAIQEINRVLKKDGKMIFLEPLGLNPIINWCRQKTPNYRTEFEHPLKFQDFKLIKKYFRIHLRGFYLFSILSYGFKTFIKSNILYKISHYILIQLDAFLLFLFPFLKYLCWIVIIEGAKHANKR